MGEFYRKYRKVFLGLTLANGLIVVLQLIFAWTHYNQHHWLALALSLFFAAMSAMCAVYQYRNWQRVLREEREYMWNTLSTDSNILKRI